MFTYQWNELSSFEVIFYPSVNVFLFAVSAFWFQRIHLGLLKVLKHGDTSKNTDTGMSTGGSEEEEADIREREEAVLKHVHVQ